MGLFRKSGVKSRIQALRQMNEASGADGGGVNYEGQSAYDVADMLKQYFRDLPEPLLTSKLSETFLQIYQCKNANTWSINKILQRHPDAVIHAFTSQPQRIGWNFIALETWVLVCHGARNCVTVKKRKQTRWVQEIPVEWGDTWCSMGSSFCDSTWSSGSGLCDCNSCIKNCLYKVKQNQSCAWSVKHIVYTHTHVGLYNTLSSTHIPS